MKSSEQNKKTPDFDPFDSAQGRNPEQRRTDFDKWKIINLGLEMGFIIALPLMLFISLGKWLDNKFGTEPWLALSGVLFAIGSTVAWFIKRFKGLI